MLLWEVMTRGKTPYEDVLPEQMLKYLTTGHRLPQPKNCPDDLYVLLVTTHSLVKFPQCLSKHACYDRHVMIVDFREHFILF